MEKIIKYPKSKEYVDKLLVPHRYCNCCGKQVLKSALPEYQYQCMYCDVDLYSIETHIEENEINDFDYKDLIEQTNSILCLDE